MSNRHKNIVTVDNLDDFYDAYSQYAEEPAAQREVEAAENQEPAAQHAVVAAQNEAVPPQNNDEAMNNDAVVQVVDDAAEQIEDEIPVEPEDDHIDFDILRAETKIHEHSPILPIDEVGLQDFSVITPIVYKTHSSSKVYLVRKIGGVDNNKLYTMKVSEKALDIRRLNTYYVAKERKILEIAHGQRRLTQMEYAFQTNAATFVVLEYDGGCDLFHRFHSVIPISFDEIRFCIAQLVLALESLHQVNVSHRDIKMESIMIDLVGNISLRDFAFSKVVSSFKDSASSIVGSAEYISPEVYRTRNDGGTYNVLVDWWSVGIITYEMINGTTPFYDMEGNNDMDDLAERVIHLPMPRIRSLMNDNIHNFVSRLLVKNPAERLGSGPDGIMEIKNHPFFRRINWNDLEEKRIKAPHKPNERYASAIAGFKDTCSLNLDNLFTVPVIANSVGCFKGFQYVAPEIVKANRYYRLMNDRDGEKIPKLVVPHTINKIPQTQESKKFQSENSSFFRKYSFVEPLVIERGAYSLCVRCENVKTKVHFICKILHSNLLTTKNEVEKILKLQGSPNVVDLSDIFYGEHLTFIVMEFLSGGNLLDRYDKIVVAEINVYDILNQMLRAIEHIDVHNVIHCDINLRNFRFMSPDSTTIKLIDFGSAIWNENSSRMPSRNFLKPTFTLECTAPEIIKFYERQLAINDGDVINSNNDTHDDDHEDDDVQPCSSKQVRQPPPINQHKCLHQSDLWSIGIIFYHLMCGEYPFFSIPFSYNEIKAQIFSINLAKNCYSDRVKFSKINRSAKSLFYQLINANAKLRTLIPEVRASDWFCKLKQQFDNSSSNRPSVPEPLQKIKKPNN